MNFKKLIKNKKFAFTLAEVVVVMAILGVMMAAFAPVVTKRTLSPGNNKILFDIMSTHNGIYYGATSDEKAVVIGDNKIGNNMPSNIDPKLLLVSKDLSTPQIVFGMKDTTTNNAKYYGHLKVDNYGNIFLGVSGAKTNIEYDDIDTGNDSTGASSTIIGYYAYSGNAIPLRSVIIGASACTTTQGFHPVDTVCIGNNSGPIAGTIPEGTTGDLIYIGDKTKDYGDGSRIYFGKNTLRNLVATNASDIRLKNVGKEFTGGLDEINQLKFYNYTYKRDAEKTPRVGVIAQDLQKVFPNAVSKNQDGYLYIRKDDMFFAALNAIKELFQKMSDNSAKIKELEERNALLEKQVQELQELYIDLAQKVDKKAAKKKLTVTPLPAETPDVPAQAEETAAE